MSGLHSRRSWIFRVVVWLLVLGALPALADWGTLKAAGDQALANKDYPAAIENFERLVRDFPSSAEAHNALGFALFMEGRMDRALFEFRQTLSLNRGHRSAQRNLILAVGRQAVNDARSLEFTEALQLLKEIESNYHWHPDISAIQFFRGKVEFFRGNSQGALEEWGKLARRRPDSTTALFVAALEHQRKGELQAAGQKFQAALKQKPDEAIFRNYYALLLDELGKTDLAIAQFETALEDPPPYLDLRLNLANLYQKQGDLDSALIQLRAARQMRPDFASVHLRLAALHLAMGSSQEAYRELGLALTREDRPALLVVSKLPQVAVWLDQDYLGTAPVGQFAEPGGHRLKTQQKDGDPATVELKMEPGKVLFVNAGTTLEVDQKEVSAVLPNEKPAIGFTLKDRKNNRWRSFQHLHRRPIMLVFWTVDAPGGPESLDALVGVQSRAGTEQFEAAAIHADPELARQALGQLMTRPASFAQLWDDGSVTEKYGFSLADMPAVVVIDLDGYITYEGKGLAAMEEAEATLRRLLGLPPRVN